MSVCINCYECEICFTCQRECGICITCEVGYGEPNVRTPQIGVQFRPQRGVQVPPRRTPQMIPQRQPQQRPIQTPQMRQQVCVTEERIREIILEVLTQLGLVPRRERREFNIE